MDGLCMLHNTKTCSKERTIARAKSSNIVHVSLAYDWGSQTDNPALIWDEVQAVFTRLKPEFPGIKFYLHSLGGKDGSIYCDICRQIRSSDAVIIDLSTNNLNVILELGIAIGFGANIFILRSKHYKQSGGLSDLNGILEYRFSRRAGRMNFEADFPHSLERKLSAAARKHLRELSDQAEATGSDR